MDASPSRARSASSCTRSLRAWNRPYSSHRGEVRAAEPLELAGAVLVHVPRVVRALGAPWARASARWASRRTRAPSVADDQRAEVLEHRARVLEVLDRLQEHDRVGRARQNVSTRSRSKRRLARAVAQARVLVRLGVGVDADDARGACARARPSRSPRRRPCRSRAGRRHVRGDPLVDDEMAAVPVVLLRHVRQRALAGQRQRRHAVGLVALQIAVAVTDALQGQPR